MNKHLIFIGSTLIMVGMLMVFVDLFPYNLPFAMIGGFLTGLGVVKK